MTNYNIHAHENQDWPHITTSAITARRRSACNQFACPKVSRALDSGACNSWIWSRWWGDWYLHCTSRLSFVDTRSILKLTMEPTILWLCSKETWIETGKPKLQPVEAPYKVADGNPLKVLGHFEVTLELDSKTGGINLKVVVTNVFQLNLLGRQAMVELGLTEHFMWHMKRPKKLSVGQLTKESPVGLLQKACKQCFLEFPGLFKLELGCLSNLRPFHTKL